MSKSYISAPPGFDKYQLAECYSQMVRVCLDGCIANAKTMQSLLQGGKDT